MAEIKKINIKGVDYDIGGGGSNDLIIELTLPVESGGNPFSNLFTTLLLSWHGLCSFLTNTDGDRDAFLDVYEAQTITAEALTNYGYDVDKIAQGYYDNLIVIFSSESASVKWVFPREYIAPLQANESAMLSPYSAAYTLKMSYCDVDNVVYTRLFVRVCPIYEENQESEDFGVVKNFELQIVEQRMSADAV